MKQQIQQFSEWLQLDSSNKNEALFSQSRSKKKYSDKRATVVLSDFLSNELLIWLENSRDSEKHAGNIFGKKRIQWRWGKTNL